MINLQTELTNIFESKNPKLDPFRSFSEKGIVLYGAGAMGKMAIDLMKTINKSPLYVIDKNKSGYIDGVKILSPENIPSQDLNEVSFVVCIAKANIQPIYDYLEELGCFDVRHFYDYSEVELKDLMPNGWAKFELKEEDKNGIQKVLKALEQDETSVAHYIQFLWWRLRRKEVIFQEYPVLSGEKYFGMSSLPDLSENEVFVDGGAHFGGTIEAFVSSTNGKFKHIYAFEPDLENQNKIKETVAKEILDRTTLFEEALYDKRGTINFKDGLGYASKININGNKKIKTITLDSFIGIKPTIIKLHIEGDELKALQGAKETIKLNRPIIMVLADHSANGLYKIAEFLIQQENYQLYFNLHDYCGNTAVFYAVPKERLNNEGES